MSIAATMRSSITPCSRSWWVPKPSILISHKIIFCLSFFLLKWMKLRKLASWIFVKRSISEDSLRRYVQFASESCIQELLAASDTNRGNGNDEWKVLTLDNGVEISKRRSGSFHTFRSRWVLTSVSPQQFITVANAIDAAKVK